MAYQILRYSLQSCCIALQRMGNDNFCVVKKSKSKCSSVTDNSFLLFLTPKNGLAV